MTGFVGNIEGLTLENKYFRQVLYTGTYAQLVVMCLQPGEEIGNEVHGNVDQFFRIDNTTCNRNIGRINNINNITHDKPSIYTCYSCSKQRFFVLRDCINRAVINDNSPFPLSHADPFFPAVNLNRLTGKKRACIFPAEHTSQGQTALLHQQ